MKPENIHIGGEYLVETAPGHPISSRRRVVVRKITKPFFSVTWTERHVTDRSTIPATWAELTHTQLVRAGQFIRTGAEQDDLARAEAKAAAFWGAGYKAHAAAALAAQRKADADLPAGLRGRSFDGRPRNRSHLAVAR